ncbi:MAG: helix-turn-helix transcriptional regulator [Clostridia bacterium]|nr:helix-turn-helix transcriptional regulator [Clostridia bacterium]
MSQQPELDQFFCELPSLRFKSVYNHDFWRKNDPRIDSAHIHNCFEIYVNLSGNVSFLVNQNVYRIQPGDVILTEPGTVHHCIYNEDCLHEHSCLWFDAEERSAIPRYLRDHQLFGHVRLHERAAREAVALMRRLSDGSNADTGLSHTFAFVRILELLATQRETVDTENEELPAQFREIMRYVNENFTQIACVEDVTSKFFVSTSTLNRCFRRYINLSFHQFLKAKKIAYAERLLKEGRSVTEACYLSGFADCSHFISFFKGKYGYTPLQYKKRYDRSNREAPDPIDM